MTALFGRGGGDLRLCTMACYAVACRVAWQHAHLPSTSNIYSVHAAGSRAVLLECCHHLVECTPLLYTWISSTSTCFNRIAAVPFYNFDLEHFSLQPLATRCRFVMLYKCQLWIYDGLPRLRREPSQLLVRLDLLARSRLVRFHPRPALRGGKYEV